VLEGYLLKSNICLLLLYILYLGVIRSGTNHQLNRFSALLCLVFSFGFLLIPLDFTTPFEWSPSVHSVVQMSSDLQGELSEAAFSHSTNIYLIIYVIGLVVFAFRTFSGFYSLIRFYANSSRYNDQGFKIISVNEKISPFTFFNLLFLGTQKLKDHEVKTLIIHEKCHKDYYHSIDVLVLELLTIIFWFNPIIWLFQKEIRIQHEYQADGHVLKSGIESVDYQHLLFRTITGVYPQIGNAFNKTSLSKRFNMMKNRKKTPKMDYFKAAFILPIMMLILTGATFVAPKVVERKIENSFGVTLAQSTTLTFGIFVGDSQVDLKKGIPAATSKLTIKTAPKVDESYEFRVSNAEITLVSGGSVKRKIRSGERVDLGPIAANAVSGNHLEISIKEYQRRDKSMGIRTETIKLESPVQISFPLY